jgi:hypothetical protein
MSLRTCIRSFINRKRSNERKLISNSSCLRNFSSVHFKYRSAISRHIDPKLADFALRIDDNVKVNIDLAYRQHEDLLEAMKSMSLNVDVLDSDGHADSVFIEDTAVIIGDRAFITNPGALSRRDEVLTVRNHLQNSYPHLEIILMEDPESTLDGGDVLFTGVKEWFSLQINLILLTLRIRNYCWSHEENKYERN